MACRRIPELILCFRRLISNLAQEVEFVHGWIGGGMGKAVWRRNSSAPHCVSKHAPLVASGMLQLQQPRYGRGYHWLYGMSPVCSCGHTYGNRGEVTGDQCNKPCTPKDFSSFTQERPTMIVRTDQHSPQRTAAETEWMKRHKKTRAEIPWPVAATAANVSTESNGSVWY